MIGDVPARVLDFPFHPVFVVHQRIVVGRHSLTQVFGDVSMVPLVLLGFLSEVALLLLSPLARPLSPVGLFAVHILLLL